MVNDRVDRRSVSRVDEQTAERLKVHRLAAGDVVLARRGDVGRFASVAQDEAGWLCGTGSMRVHVPDDDVVCPGFLRHAMSHPDVAEWLAGHAVGATMPNLNAAIVARLPLLVPAIATQRRIAAVLSAFDELIEINERRTELLTDLAASLYREWFVRFRFPGHEDLELVDSELGPIPRGWAVCHPGDVCSRITDGAHAIPPSTVLGKPMASVKDMTHLSLDLQTCRLISAEDFVRLSQQDCKPLVGDRRTAERRTRGTPAAGLRAHRAGWCHCGRGGADAKEPDPARANPTRLPAKPERLGRALPRGRADRRRGAARRASRRRRGNRRAGAAPVGAHVDDPEPIMSDAIVPLDHQLLTADEVPELLRLPVSTIYDLARTGRLPHLKIGRALRFSRSDLEVHLAERCRAHIEAPV
jgi:excisionase family DNA binding protein